MLRKSLPRREQGTQSLKHVATVWIVVVWAALAPVPLAFTEPISTLKPSGYVNDFAGVLSAATQNQLNEMCRQVEQKTGTQIAVVTIKSTDGQEIFNYGVDLYQKWGIGKKGKDNGVLVLLAVQDRKYYVNVGYGLEPILPDGKVGGFGREAVPYLKNNDYDGAISLLTSRIVDVIAKDAGVQITTSQPRRIEPLTSRPHETEVSPGAIVAIIVVIIVVLAVPPLRRLLFFMFLFGGGGGGGYRGGGGWDGGGFGGGGGGFGGFGGGSTGGGGAGGSW